MVEQVFIAYFFKTQKKQIQLELRKEFDYCVPRWCKIQHGSYFLNMYCGNISLKDLHSPVKVPNSLADFATEVCS